MLIKGIFIKTNTIQHGYSTSKNIIYITKLTFINNRRYKLIQQSKVVLACLELAYQNDWNSKLELANNRGFKQPRPVIALFLESRNQNFPDTEISAQCFLGRSDTKVFDISSFSFNSLHQDNIGISPLQMELDRLIGI